MAYYLTINIEERGVALKGGGSPNYGHIRSMSRLFLFLVCITVCFFGSGDFTSAMAGGDLTYYDQAHDIAKEMDQILIKHGICNNTDDCNKKQVRFLGWYSWGIYVATYSIKDGRVLNELLNVCSKFFFDHKCQIKLEVNIYPVSKTAELGAAPWNKPKPIKITMKGGNK